MKSAERVQISVEIVYAILRSNAFKNPMCPPFLIGKFKDNIFLLEPCNYLRYIAGNLEKTDY